MTSLPELGPLLAALRTECRDAGVDDAVTASLDRLQARLDEPLIVAIAGKVKAGKSTLLNALVGEQLAPTDAGECTRIVTWYRNGPTYRVIATLDDGAQRQLSFRRDDGALEVDLAGIAPERVDRLVVDWPSSRLASITLIDTPGLDSTSAGVSDRTHAFLTRGDADGEPGEADAVLYLMRHVHRSDLTFLEAFRDDAHAGASPISAIAVLSRADEVGACRLDAMTSAQRVAGNWRDDPRLRRLCQTVVPIAGLAAEAGATLREDEYRALATLATRPRAEIDALLLSTDRFVADVDCGVTQIEREMLLARLGVFGVRLSISLIRLGAAPTATVLAGELTNRSGIAALRTILSTVFAERRDVLKARVALAGIDAALGCLPLERFERFRIDLERIEASTHEFAEVHLLNAVRAGDIRLRPAELEEVERLLGRIGGPARERLGLDDAADIRAALVDGVDRWRRRAEHPMSSLDLSRAAHAIARTYEGLLARS
jgi:predicted GTPase